MWVLTYIFYSFSPFQFEKGNHKKESKPNTNHMHTTSNVVSFKRQKTTKFTKLSGTLDYVLQTLLNDNLITLPLIHPLNPSRALHTKFNECIF